MQTHAGTTPNGHTATYHPHSHAAWLGRALAALGTASTKSPIDNRHPQSPPCAYHAPRTPLTYGDPAVFTTTRHAVPDDARMGERELCRLVAERLAFEKVHPIQDLHHILHGSRRLMQQLHLLGIQTDLHHLLHPIRAQHHRHA